MPGTCAALAVATLFVLSGFVASGSLGDPTPGGFVRFEDIRRSAFTAVAVQRQFGDPSAAPLILRVHVTGDAAGADVAEATDWLAHDVNVVLVEDPDGAPLYLTNRNLIATSGPGALGATIRSGMAVEMVDERMSPCVVAHEVLHFLGLHHEDDPENLMFARCSPDKLSEARVSDGQVGHVARIAGIVAITPAGIVTWASR